MQIMALETEVARLQRSVDGSKAAYQALHKQYQEQCGKNDQLHVGFLKILFVQQPNRKSIEQRCERKKKKSHN
jgi:hypothetical protein